MELLLVSNVVTAFEYHIWTNPAGACMAGLTCKLLVRAWIKKGAYSRGRDFMQVYSV